VEGIGAKEIAKTFLEAIEAPFAPEEFKDVYREELQAMIAKKMSEAGAAPAVQMSAATGPGVDILDQEEHRNGPQAARPGNSADTKDTRTRDGDQEQTAIAKITITSARVARETGATFLEAYKGYY
jgi:non-homologous end joining protein Ku